MHCFNKKCYFKVVLLPGSAAQLAAYIIYSGNFNNGLVRYSDHGHVPDNRMVAIPMVIFIADTFGHYSNCDLNSG